MTAPGQLGGTDGNEILTTTTGAVLTALLAAEGVTIIALGSLLGAHMFIGVILLAPVTLKLLSTGYRFVRYYTGDRAYRAKGPPHVVLRVLAPILVAATVTVLVSGVWLMLLGKRSDTVLQVHKVSFIVFGVVFAIHFLAHIARVARSVSRDWRAPRRRAVAGAGRRGIAVAVSLAVGLVLALVALSDINGWHGRDHHDRGREAALVTPR
jgi:hypothetical protein